MRKVAKVVLAKEAKGIGSGALPRMASRKASSSRPNPLSIPEVLCFSRFPPRRKVVIWKSSQVANPRPQKTSILRQDQYAVVGGVQTDNVTRDNDITAFGLDPDDLLTVDAYLDRSAD